MDMKRLHKIEKLAYTDPKYTKKLMAINTKYQTQGSNMADQLQVKSSLINKYNIILTPIVKDEARTGHFNRHAMSQLADAMSRYVINHRGDSL